MSDVPPDEAWFPPLPPGTGKTPEEGCPDCGSISQCPTNHEPWCRVVRGSTYDDLGWWAISGESVLAMLRRVAAGEDPDLVYAEEYANSDHERPST